MVVYRCKETNATDQVILTWVPVPFMVIFSVVLLLIFNTGSILGSLLIGAFPLMVTTKLYVTKQKIAKMFVREVNAVFRYPKDLAPELRRVEIKDLSGESKFYYLRQFERVSDFEVKRIKAMARIFHNLTKDYRLFKVQPEQSWSDGTMDKKPNPLIYLLNRDCLELNLDLLNYIRNFNLTKADKAALLTLKYEAEPVKVPLCGGNTLSDYMEPKQLPQS